jgi:hypothetical protein
MTCRIRKALWTLHLHQPAAALVTAVTFGAAALAVLHTGGADRAFVQLFYVPVILAAIFLGSAEASPSA